MCNKGFTLIEVMIVLVILGVIASVSYGAFVEYQCRDSYTKECKEFRAKHSKQNDGVRCIGGYKFTTEGRQILNLNGGGILC